MRINRKPGTSKRHIFGRAHPPDPLKNRLISGKNQTSIPEKMAAIPVSCALTDSPSNQRSSNRRCRCK
jgi:hypothetical protein